VELDSNTLKKLIIKLAALEKSLKELKRIKRADQYTSNAMSGIKSPAFSIPAFSPGI
jgi:hypothetical protein